MLTQVAQESIERPDVGPSANRQMHIRELASRGASWIDDDDLQLGPLALCLENALKQNRMTPGRVGADEHDEIREAQIVVADGHDVFAERTLVSSDGGGHAQP